MVARLHLVILATIVALAFGLFYWYDGHCLTQPSFWDEFHPLDKPQILKYQGITLLDDGYDEETLFVMNTGVKVRTWKGTWYRVDSFVDTDGTTIADSKLYRICGNQLLIKEGNLGVVIFALGESLDHIDVFEGVVSGDKPRKIAVLKSRDGELTIHAASGIGFIMTEANVGGRLLYRMKLEQVIPYSSPHLF